MFNEFSHRHTDCFVDGVPEKVILSRDSRSSTVFRQEYLYNGVFAPTSTVKTGALVTNGESFLVQSLRRTVENDCYCLMVKTNAEVEIQRWSQELDENDNPIGTPDFHPVQSNVVVHAQYVTARLRQDDVGLLPTTVYVLLMQSNVNIKRPTELDSPDRVILNGRKYQVDAIDDFRYPNLFYVQLSEDRR
jgi:hypothetical protein